jgi:hypothetical protein
MLLFYRTFDPFPCLSGGSDFIASLRAFKYWKESKAKGLFTKETEPGWCEQHHLSLFNLREIEDLSLRIRESLSSFGLCSPTTSLEKNHINEWRAVQSSKVSKDPQQRTEYKDSFLSSEVISQDVITKARKEEQEEGNANLQELHQIVKDSAALSCQQKEADSEATQTLKLEEPPAEELYIKQAIDILNNASRSQPQFNSLTLADFIVQDTGNVDTLRLFSFIRDIKEDAHLINSYPAVDGKAFENPLARIMNTTDKIRLEKEPDCLILCSLLYGVYNHNNLYHVKVDSRQDFADCPVEFSIKDTILVNSREYLSSNELHDMLKSFGNVKKTFCQTPYEIHSGRGDIRHHKWFVEFYKPHQLIWTPCRDLETLGDVPDALYLCTKDQRLRAKIPPHFATKCKLRHNTTSLAPEPSVILSRMSLFQPILLHESSDISIHVNAGNMMSVSHGECWVADNLTCFMSKRPHFGDALEAMFGATLREDTWSGEWFVSVRGVDSPIRVIDPHIVNMVRLYLDSRQASKETLTLMCEEPVHASNLREIEEADSLWDVEELWKKEGLTVREAGKLLEKSILLLAEDGVW